jgi:hypothetical protein
MIVFRSYTYSICSYRIAMSKSRAQPSSSRGRFMIFPIHRIFIATKQTVAKLVLTYTYIIINKICIELRNEI